MRGHRDFLADFDAGLKGGHLPPCVTAPDPAEVERRFAVYRNNVVVSLTEALARRFPVIRRLVGQEFFAAMARIYAETHRPATPVLLEWGESFPTFLEGFPPVVDYPYMADVARIELARGRAFHAEDAPPAGVGVFAGADLNQLVLRLHASVQVLWLDHPAVTIWTRNQPGIAPEGAIPAGAEIALVLRDRAFNVPVALIGTGDATLIGHLQAGLALIPAAEAARSVEPRHDAQPLILRLMQAGVILNPVEDGRCAH